MTNKLRVAFDPTTTWDYLGFRDLIKDMVGDSSEIEVYIITTNTDTDYIDDVALEAGGIESNRIFQVADNQTVITTLANNQILLYLTAENELVVDVNAAIPLELVLNDITGCQAILVNNILDANKLQPKYVTMLQFWIKQIEKYSTSGQEKC